MSPALSGCHFDLAAIWQSDPQRVMSGCHFYLAAILYVAQTIGGGGRVHFELEGVNIQRALSGNPAEFVGRYTEWELQTICRRPDFFRNTSFYRNGRLLTPQEVEQLGIRPQQIGGSGGR
jgi:hypothetical protein